MLEKLPIRIFPYDIMIVSYHSGVDKNENKR
jgi:hypothetical protein